MDSCAYSSLLMYSYLYFLSSSLSSLSPPASLIFILFIFMLFLLLLFCVALSSLPLRLLDILLCLTFLSIVLFFSYFYSIISSSSSSCIFFVFTAWHNANVLKNSSVLKNSTESFYVYTLILANKSLIVNLSSNLGARETVVVLFKQNSFHLRYSPFYGTIDLWN